MKTKSSIELPSGFTGMNEVSDGERHILDIGIEWFENLSFHNKNGPAWISFIEDEDIQWWLNGKYYKTKDRWQIEVEKLKKK